MSTGLNCFFFRDNGRWYYLLEDYSSPKMAWDWREYATCYGPFASEEAANKHLQDNHANPGGSSVIVYDAPYIYEEQEYDFISRRLTGRMVSRTTAPSKKDEIIDKLIGEAINPERGRSW